MTPDLLDDLAEYISVLSASLEKANNAQDRSAYERHLAAATSIRQSLRRSDVHHARQQVANEERDFGWSFLPGEEGSAAEAAFVRFKKLFEEKAGQ